MEQLQQLLNALAMNQNMQGGQTPMEALQRYLMGAGRNIVQDFRNKMNIEQGTYGIPQGQRMMRQQQDIRDAGGYGNLYY